MNGIGRARLFKVYLVHGHVIVVIIFGCAAILGVFFFLF